MALLAWADAFGMCRAVLWTYAVAARFTAASRWVGSSFKFQPGALWECCGKLYLSTRRCAPSLGRKTDSAAFSAVRGLGGLNPWRVNGDMENQGRTAPSFHCVVGPASYGFLPDKESRSSSISSTSELIHWIMMVKGRARVSKYLCQLSFILNRWWGSLR